MIASLDGAATVDGLSGGLGGPAGAQLAAADLIDELCLTVAPCLLGGDSRRILAGAAVNMNRFALHMICEDSGYLFLRLRRAR